MTLFNRLSPVALLALTVSMMLFIVGCTPEEDNSDVIGDTNDFDAVLAEVTREAPNTSDYTGVTLTLVGYELTQESDGAAAGTIIVEIEFNNTTDETVTLPFGDDNYTLRDAGGFNIVSSDTSESLINPEIPENGAINGTLEYAVTEGEATYFFQVGDYEDIEISAIPPNSNP